MIEYSDSSDVKESASMIVATLKMNYIDLERIHFIRSRGSRSHSIVARIHSVSRIFRQTLGTQITYIIEVLSERYDRLPEEDKERTLIHELLHIPKAFGGGLHPHRRYVTQHNVERVHRLYRKSRSTSELE